MRNCIQCGTSNTPKWYRKDGGFICQSDYRKSSYQKSADLQKKQAKIRYQRSKSQKCHQKLIKEKTLGQDIAVLGADFLKTDLGEYTIGYTALSREHIDFIKRYEWLGTIGNYPKWTFEARYRGHLAAVVLINEPNQYSKIGKSREALIQRGATVSWAHEHLGSKIVSWSIRWMVANTTKRFFVAYSDPRANEIGTIYQACNFRYLGKEFGARAQYRHPVYKKGKKFSIQSLRRTSVLKQWAKANGIKLEPHWFKDNGFKDLSKLPMDIKNRWYTWGNEIIAQSIKEGIESKGKYICIRGRTPKETRMLLREIDPKVFKPYPKRSHDSTQKTT